MKKQHEGSPDDAHPGEGFEAFEELEQGPAPAGDLDETKINLSAPAQDVEGLAGFDDLSADEARLESRQPGSGGDISEHATVAGELSAELSELAPDVPVNLVAVIGKTTINLGALLKYRIGQVIDLGRTPGETVDLVANGRLIARGELVEMDGKLGVKVLKMVR